jgi:hypothetical protein
VVRAESLHRGVFAVGITTCRIGRAAGRRVRAVVDTSGTRLAVPELARSRGGRAVQAIRGKLAVVHVGLSFWAEEIQEAAEEGRKW